MDFRQTFHHWLPFTVKLKAWWILNLCFLLPRFGSLWRTLFGTTCHSGRNNFLVAFSKWIIRYSCIQTSMFSNVWTVLYVQCLHDCALNVGAVLENRAQSQVSEMVYRQTNSCLDFMCKYFCCNPQYSLLHGIQLERKWRGSFNRLWSIRQIFH